MLPYFFWVKFAVPSVLCKPFEKARIYLVYLNFGWNDTLWKQDSWSENLIKSEKWSFHSNISHCTKNEVFH